jgi:hypothetical protein
MVSHCSGSETNAKDLFGHPIVLIGDFSMLEILIDVKDSREDNLRKALWQIRWVLVLLVTLIFIILTPLLVQLIVPGNPARITIPVDVLSVLALATFVYVQFDIRGLFAIWAANEDRGYFSNGVIWVLLLLNTALIVAMLSTSLSILTFDLAIKHGLYNPFGHQFTLPEVLLVYSDQAMKGLLIDVASVFNLHIQNALRLDAREHWGFGLLLVAFRITMTTLTAVLTLKLLFQAFHLWRKVEQKITRFLKRGRGVTKARGHS